MTQKCPKLFSWMTMRSEPVSKLQERCCIMLAICHNQLSWSRKIDQQDFHLAIHTADNQLGQNCTQHCTCDGGTLLLFSASDTVSQRPACRNCHVLQACLVAAWVKSGLWLSPDVSRVLDIQLVSNQVVIVLLPRPNPKHNVLSAEDGTNGQIKWLHRLALPVSASCHVAHCQAGQ